ncbi:unnamed protein product [Arabidopsis lyrata]|uniref:Uncharacterized protein n=1 Tax=Arabidopsis lyrata subsp. lyrata TaxID=81972 RepID=D7M099_ARALL|nr:hypothetical protein ARALYDRAFT_911546 [Arabidopsis lyrata subsp. lyrata]CAH8273020.1 unnamed protein product [Arabidopsis lyrata]
MATPNQESIDTFISSTGASEAVALQKLEVISIPVILFSFFVSLYDWRWGK